MNYLKRERNKKEVNGRENTQSTEKETPRKKTSEMIASKPNKNGWMGSVQKLKKVQNINIAGMHKNIKVTAGEKTCSLAGCIKL